MLRKKDLVKEFELVVKQEIKNHNDHLLRSNTQLEDFKNKLQEYKNSHYFELSKKTEQLNDFEKRLQNLEQSYNSSTNWFEKTLENLSEKFDKLCKDYEHIKKETTSLNCTRDSFTLQLHQKKESEDELRHSYDKLEAQVQSDTRKFYDKISQECSLLDAKLNEALLEFRECYSYCKKLSEENKKQIDAIKDNVTQLYKSIHPLEKKLEYLQKKTIGSEKKTK